ncbi:hypothetical protein WA026_000239, partial [Henosepilachna vigintioctopunctata]
LIIPPFHNLNFLCLKKITCPFLNSSPFVLVFSTLSTNFAAIAPMPRSEMLTFYSVVDLCNLSNRVSDYPFISQGKTRIPGVNDSLEAEVTDGKVTIPNVDDAEELQLTD